MRQLILLIALSLVLAASPTSFAAMDESEIIAQLKVERDSLRKELAAAKLEIQVLKDKLAKQPAGDKDAPPIADAGGRKQWVVEVTMNTRPDTSALESSLASAKSSHVDATKGVEEARKRVTELSKINDWDNSNTVSKYNDKSRTYETKRELTADQKKSLEQAKLTVSKLEHQQQVAKVKITRIEQDLSIKKNTRSVEGMLEDGSPVRVNASGPACATADGLKVGQKYSVVGSGVENSTGWTIQMRSAVPAAGASEAAEAKAE